MKTARAGALFVVIGLLGTCVTAGAADAAAWDGSKLVSEKSCKLCHGKDKVGNQHAVWKKGPHAKAVLTLKTPEAAEVAKKAGLKAGPNESGKPFASGKCLKCHATAYGFTEAKVTEKVPVADGVTCQSCHGPAKAYKSKHAKDVAAAKEKHGMIEPTAKNTCLRCHNPESPSYDPERYTTKDGKKVGFDFIKAAAKVAHPKP